MKRLATALIALTTGVPALGATLWSTDDSHLGPGLFFGPGAFTNPTPLFPAVIRDMAFHTDRDFVTPFFNNGASPPNVADANGELLDGALADGSLINENVTLGPFAIGGVTLMPYVANTGHFEGEQISVTSGDVTMTMDLVLDLGIGPRGIIKLPFYGTTGVVTVPLSAQTAAGGTGIDQAGPIKSGQTIAGRIGNFNADGFIDGTIVAVGVMPIDSPVYPGQPYALTRNFETDIAIDGQRMGSACAVHSAYRQTQD